ncbi:MAG TPA: ABC transporter permease, partial [Pseudolysinimonas sp.]
MIVYLIRRVINYSILTAVAASLAYVLASIGLKPVAALEARHPRPPQSVIDMKLDALGANPHDPLIERTWVWFTNLFHGDLGMTINNHQVTDQIAVRAGVSLQLLLIGSIVGAIVGVVLGIWGAVAQYKASDQVVTFVSYLVFATPTFVLAILSMIVATQFNHAIGTQLIVFSGQVSADAPSDFWGNLADRLSHLLLPTLVLIVVGAASYSRYQRNAMLDVL